MCQHNCAFERVWLAKRVVRIVYVILRRDNIDTACQQLLHASSAAALRLAIEPRRAYKVDVSVDRNSNSCRRDHIDDFGGIEIVVSGHRPAVACCDAAIEALAHGLKREIFEAARVGVVGIVHQHVNIEIVLFGHRKADVDMLAGFLVGVFIPGQTTDHIAAFLDCLFHQFAGARVAHKSFLRERNDLNAAIFFHLVARQQQAARGAQAADRSDIAE